MQLDEGQKRQGLPRAYLAFAQALAIDAPRTTLTHNNAMNGLNRFFSAEELDRTWMTWIKPSASLFCDHDGPPTAFRLRHLYRRWGFAMHGEEDHLAQQLCFLHHLGTTQAPGVLQHQFIRDEVLSWLPILQVSLEDTGFQAAHLTARLIELLDEHMRLTPPAPVVTTVKTQPLAEDIDLQDIVTWLITPARCGMFLGRDRILGIARSLNLGIGFGDRRTLLINLFHAAGRYQSVVALISAIRQFALSFQKRLAAIDPEDRTQAYARLDQTVARLSTLADAGKAFLRSRTPDKGGGTCSIQ